MGRFGHQSGFLGAARAALLAIATALLGPALRAQEVPAATFSVDVRLVRLLVSVKDATGQPVGSLEQGDFRVFDSGVPQEIALFEHHTETPLSISILVDTSGSTAKDLRYELDSVERFLRALLRNGNPDDAAALYAFNDEVTLLTSFTRRERRLRDSLDELRASSGTSMYDAVYLAASDLEDRAEDRREGRNVMVIVTDGGDTTSSASFRQALDSAQLADAAIYPILVVPIVNEAGRNLGGERALELFASDTGGRVFEPTVGEELDAAFDEILHDLRTQYLIGYYPRGLPEDAPRFRRVRVELTRDDLRALTRTGYYGDAAAP